MQALDESVLDSVLGVPQMRTRHLRGGLQRVQSRRRRSLRQLLHGRGSLLQRLTVALRRRLPPVALLLRYRVQGSGFRVQGSGFRVQVQGSGFRFQGSVFRVQGLGFSPLMRG